MNSQFQPIKMLPQFYTYMTKIVMIVLRDKHGACAFLSGSSFRSTFDASGLNLSFPLCNRNSITVVVFLPLNYLHIPYCRTNIITHHSILTCTPIQSKFLPVIATVNLKHKFTQTFTIRKKPTFESTDAQM